MSPVVHVVLDEIVTFVANHGGESASNDLVQK